MQGNFGFTSDPARYAEKAGESPALSCLPPPFRLTLDNPYGRFEDGQGRTCSCAGMGARRGPTSLIYRFPQSCLAKWCRPNYNSAVATFCHNIARGSADHGSMTAAVRDDAALYIDDVVGGARACRGGAGEPATGDFCLVPVEHPADARGALPTFCISFRASREDRKRARYGRSPGCEAVCYLPVLICPQDQLFPIL